MAFLAFKIYFDLSSGLIPLNGVTAPNSKGHSQYPENRVANLPFPPVSALNFAA